MSSPLMSILLFLEGEEGPRIVYWYHVPRTGDMVQLDDGFEGVVKYVTWKGDDTVWVYLIPRPVVDTPH